MILKRDKSRKTINRENPIKGFKGFNINRNGALACLDYVFNKKKKVHSIDSGIEIGLCHDGFHFCKNMKNVFSFYAPLKTAYHHVIGYGDAHFSNNKIAVRHLKIGPKIGFHEMLELIGGKIEFEGSVSKKLNTCKNNYIYFCNKTDKNLSYIINNNNILHNSEGKYIDNFKTTFKNYNFLIISYKIYNNNSSSKNYMVFCFGENDVNYDKIF